MKPTNIEFRLYSHIEVGRCRNIYYIFSQVQWLMFVVVNFSVMFNAFGHIHLVILIWSSDYSSKYQYLLEIL